MTFLRTPLNDETVRDLTAGEHVALTGLIYTARDAAHRLMCEALNKDEAPPFELKGQTIYYAGPTPPKPDQVIGSCGPTTSSRMDPYAPRLMELGVKAMIGKGNRSQSVIDAMSHHNCVYFASIGGAAALLAQHVTRCEIIAYPWLGPEAVRMLWVEGYPCIVAIDSRGGNVYTNRRSSIAL